MTVHRDDSMITGDEFRIRRLAINLQDAVIISELDITRSAMNRWQQGKSNVPKYARTMLEMAESDIQAMIDALVLRARENPAELELPLQPEKGWPWGEPVWFVVLSRARFFLSEMGLRATIGPQHEKFVRDENP